MHLIQKIYNKYYFALLLSVLTLTIFGFVWGFYLEDSEKMTAALLYGNLAEPPTEYWFVENWLLQIPLIVFLSKCFNTVPVYGIWHLALIVVRLSTWNYLSIRIVRRMLGDHPISVTLLALLISFAINYTSLIHVYYLRDAVLLSSASLLLFLDNRIHHHKKRDIPLLVLFMWACLVRASAALLVIIPITLLVAWQEKNILASFKTLKWQWIIILACFLLIEGNKWIQDNPAMQIEQRYEYALTDRGAILPIEVMKTTKDSVRYLALTNFFLIIDSAQITNQFIASVIDHSKYGSAKINKTDFLHFTKKGVPVIKQHLYFIVLFYVLLLLILIATNRKELFSFVVWNISCWAVVVAIAMKLNTYPYFFQSWLGLLFGGSLWILTTKNITLSGFSRISLLVLSIIIFFQAYQTIKQHAAIEKQYNQTAKEYLNRISTITVDRTLILWDYENEYLPSALFSRNETLPLKKCIYMNLFFHTYYSFAQVRSFYLLGASQLNWAQLNYALKKRHSTTALVMSKELGDFLPFYFKVLYGLSFNLQQTHPAQEIFPGNFVYQLYPD
jgi:hypothetical protein